MLFITTGIKYKQHQSFKYLLLYHAHETGFVNKSPLLMLYDGEKAQISTAYNTVRL